MFDSLDEQMKHDDAVAVSRGERMLKWASVAVISVAVFGVLYFAVAMIE